MRVALTGGSGFTGRYVAAALDQQGIDSFDLDADLTDASAVDRAVEEATFDGLIHLAGRAFVDASDWEAFYQVNQLGTYHLLHAVARVRPGTRCVLASSAQVYGQGAEGLIAEDAPTAPANHYAVSKLAMELGAVRWGDRLELVVTRPFNYTGVGQATNYLIPKIVEHFRCRASVIELGNLWVKRDFGDVRSVARAYAGLMTASAPPSLVNVCSGQVWSIQDILSVLGELSGHRPEVVTNAAFVRRDDPALLGGDADLLRATLPEWSPHQLPDTLLWMYEHEST